MWDGGREGHELILLQQVGAHLQRHRRVHQSGSEKIFKKLGRFDLKQENLGGFEKEGCYFYVVETFVQLCVRRNVLW